MAVLLSYNEATGKLCGDMEHLDACCPETGCPDAEIHLTVTGIGSFFDPPPDCSQLNVTDLILRPVREPHLSIEVDAQCVNDVQPDECIFSACVDAGGETYWWEVALIPPELTPEHKWFVLVQVSDNIEETFIVWNGPLPGGYIDYDGPLCDLEFDFDVLNLCKLVDFLCDDFGIAIHGAAVCIEQETVACACHRCPELIDVVISLVDSATCDAEACDLLNGSWQLTHVDDPAKQTTSVCDLATNVERCQWTQRDIGLFICDDGEHWVYLCRVDAWVVVPTGGLGGANDPYTLYVEIQFQGWDNTIPPPEDPCAFGALETWRLAFESLPIETACATLDEEFGICFNDLTFCDGSAALARMMAPP